MKNYDNILDALYGSSWAMTDAKMEEIRRVVDKLTAGDLQALRQEYEAQRNEAMAGGGSPYALTQVRGTTAVMNIRGTIMPRANMMMLMSGGVSADLITADAKDLAASKDIRTVILNVDSNGGHVRGLKEAADALRSIRESGKRVFAFANFSMYSAAYYLAAQADQIFVRPDSGVGSIGTMIFLQQAPKEERERTTIIRSEGKVLLNSYEDYPPEELAELQLRVDRYTDMFVDALAAGRNISLEQAKQMANGKTYEGEAAIKAGFADGQVESLDELLEIVQGLDSADAKVERLTAALTAQVDANRSIVAQLEAAQTLAEELKNSIDELTAETEREKIEAAVTAAVESGRLVAGRADDMIAEIVEGRTSLTSFVSIMEQIPENAVLPKEGENVASSNEEENDDPYAPRNDYDRRMMAGTSLGKRYADSK